LEAEAPALSAMVANNDVELTELPSPFVDHTLVDVAIYTESDAVTAVVAVDTSGGVTVLSGRPAHFDALLAAESLAPNADVALQVAQLFVRTTAASDDPITIVESTDALPF